MPRWLDVFCAHVDKGNSVILFIIILVLSVFAVFACAYDKSILKEWLYEPLISIPTKLQTPELRQWFHMTRGGYYVAVQKGDQSAKEFFDQCRKQPKTTNTHALFTGWAFTHFALYVLIGLMCPKLIPFAVIMGIFWEIAESYVHAHCALDIFWNLCGCLVGLFLRGLVEK
jgi:hypothetical protein